MLSMIWNCLFTRSQEKQTENTKGSDFRETDMHIQSLNVILL